jgi:hypothetical protein
MNMTEYDRNADDLNEWSFDKLERGYLEELYKNNCTAADFDTFHGLANAQINLQCSHSSSACEVTFPDGIRVRDRLGSGGVCCLKDTIFHMFMPKFV